MSVELLPGLNVSRETFDKLRAFEDLARRWTTRINLVSPSTVNDIWHRHIIDSAQIVKYSPDPSNWADIGSGGGFPGIVVAVVLAEAHPEALVTLVESDNRKSAFLKTAISKLDLSASVKADRIEGMPQLNSTTLSARALAPLNRLLDHAHRHLSPDGTALFMKGERWESEISEAQDKWSFEYDVIKSHTEDSAAILKVADIKTKR